MQEAFEKFRRRRQEEFWRLTRRTASVQRELWHPDARWQLRMKFLEQAKRYIGVPYAKRYHEPGTPEYKSPLFLDCCGFIRRVLQDLTEEFGFSVGPGNQAYLYDTLPVTLPSQEELKPGDLVFVSGSYFDLQRKRQPHDIVHVEIWLGDGERSLGARWKWGKAQVFDSYRFVSSSYRGMAYHFKSIETWLQGTCRSHCPEHKWASVRLLPGRRSIFHPLGVQDEPAEEDMSPESSPSWPQPGKEVAARRLEPLLQSVSNCELSESKSREALDLQGCSTPGLGAPKVNSFKRDKVTEAKQGQSHFLESSGPHLGPSGALLEGNQVRGLKEGPTESPPTSPSQGADAQARPTGLSWDSFGNLPKKSHSIPKLDVKGILAGGAGKRKKKGKPGTQGDQQPFEGPSSVDAGESQSFGS